MKISKKRTIIIAKSTWEIIITILTYDFAQLRWFQWKHIFVIVTTFRKRTIARDFLLLCHSIFGKYQCIVIVHESFRSCA